jgi:hypothetical protein
MSACLAFVSIDDRLERLARRAHQAGRSHGERASLLVGCLLEPIAKHGSGDADLGRELALRLSGTVPFECLGCLRERHLRKVGVAGVPGGMTGGDGLGFGS